MFEIKGKSAVIVGGGRGIGAAISMALANEGAVVTIIDADTVSNSVNHYQTINIDGYKHANELAGKLNLAGACATALNVNACDEQAVISAFNKIAEDNGGIDILVNAIGSTHIARTVNSTTHEFKSIIETNLLAPYIACREAAKVMLKNKNGGSIINISSISGKIGFPGIPAYCTAKSGLIGLTISLALEVAENDIQVNAVCPGIVKTNMWKYLQDEMIESEESSEQFWERMLDMIPQKRVQPPEDIAAFIVSIIKNKSITGQSLSIDGGWNRNG